MLSFKKNVEAKKSTCTIKDCFKNVDGLTLSKVFSKDAVLAYISKQETNQSATVYCGCGRKEMFDTKIEALCNKPGQQDVFKFLKSVKYEDAQKTSSATGHILARRRKGQKDLTCRLLPMDSVDQLLDAVTEVVKYEKADVFMLDNKRTKGDKTSFSNMFKAIKIIRN